MSADNVICLFKLSKAFFNSPASEIDDREADEALLTASEYSAR